MYAIALTAAKAALGASLVLGFATMPTPEAQAGTGTSTQLDSLCSHPAFAAQNTPKVGINGATPTGQPLVGIRKNNAYCTSDSFVNPPDYGSGNP